MNKYKKREMKDIFPVFLIGGLFVLIHGLALLVIGQSQTEKWGGAVGDVAIMGCMHAK